MKFSILWIALATMICATTISWAGGPESGFFLGGGGYATYVNGTGTWNNVDFEIDSAFPSDDNSGAIGMAWTDLILLGVKPVVGYKFNSNFALQLGYAFNITKSSRQSGVSSDGLVFYEQGLSVEWGQDNFEALAFYYPDSELEYYLFGGLEIIKIETKITLFENAEYQDDSGFVNSNGDFQIFDDQIAATGFIIGAGVEFTSDNDQRAAYVSMQYSRSLTDDSFFETEDFKVDMGGITLNVGVKWYLF